MKIISHRGNVSGPGGRENSPEQIDRALALSYDVEVDLWVVDNAPWLGHDGPECRVSQNFLKSRSDKLWVHCKNHDCLDYAKSLNLNYFFHENEPYAVTSDGFLWCHPSSVVLKNSVAVLPEINDKDIGQAYGVCTDFPERYSV